jgi:hypothetical protein
MNSLDKKKQQSKEISLLTKEFLRNGGKIQKLSYADTSFKEMSLRELYDYRRVHGGSILDYSSKSRSTKGN